jgi:hypothetical protein
MTASNATITGTINATTGYIGSPTDGWAIDEYGLSANSSAAHIILGDAATIQMGSYSLTAIGSELTLYETANPSRNLIETDLLSENGRLILGYWDTANNKSRQVEVAKSAQIAFSTVNSLTGGLRNMYTIGDTYYSSSIYSSDAKTGDVLLVWE